MQFKPEPLPSAQPAAPVRSPVLWSNEDSWAWTSLAFPQPGDSVRLLREIGDYVSGTVVKSEAQTQADMTTVWFMLDTNGNRKADMWVKLIIDSRNGGEIRTKFSEIAEE